MADKLSLELENDYEASDSEGEYTERQKGLLKKVRKGKKQDSDEEEIFGFDDDDDDSDPEKFEADSDIDEGGDGGDGLPDERAWGKKKSAFYNTDFQDKDYRGYTEREEEVANQEQAEALLIQKRLANEINESDFNLDMFALPESQQEPEESRVKSTKTDLSDLSRKQKLAAFKAEAPEFDGLVQDFEERFTESKDMLIPALELLKSVDFPNHPLVEFIECRNELIINYCTNISFYLMLKAKRVKVRNHPLVKRLIQFRQLICQLDDIYEYVVKHQLEILLAEFGDENNSAENSKLKMLQRLKIQIATRGDEGTSEEGSEIAQPLFTHKYSSESEDEGGKMEVDDEEIGDSKRQITRQIAKNKGLTATKRKEMRNPRVKNKNKFRKALIRRKGAVREVKSKVELYGGEASGVKTHLKRSIKIQ